MYLYIQTRRVGLACYIVNTVYCTCVFSIYFLPPFVVERLEGGLSDMPLLLVYVNPTKGKWTVRAVILLLGMGSGCVHLCVCMYNKWVWLTG